jgi:GT2 family glycosyltransferase
MSEITSIVVGINHWDDVTKPFLDSIYFHEPKAKVILVDNASDDHYRHDQALVVRTPERMGYGSALNFGMSFCASEKIICFNNDCKVIAPFLEQVSKLNVDTVWGSDWSYDVDHKFKWVQSAWLILHRNIIRTIGLFDHQCGAAFEDFDMERRALDAGYKIDVAPLPIIHLDKHTRLEEGGYSQRWQDARLYFEKKHDYKTQEWNP